MSEESTEPQGQQEEAPEFTPITSQEDLNRVIGERIKSVKAKFADYGDLKAKAAKFDEVEQANKSELERAQERINELEQRSTAAERAALVTRIASEEGVIPEVLHGDTEEEMRAAAARIKEWAGASRSAPPSPKSLASGSSGSSDDGGSRAAAAIRRMRSSN